MDPAISTRNFWVGLNRRSFSGLSFLSLHIIGVLFATLWYKYMLIDQIKTIGQVLHLPYKENENIQTWEP